MMFSDLMTRLKATTGNDTVKPSANAGASKRKYSRRICDDCVAEINGKACPVIDWSLGGVQVMSDSRFISLNDDVEITLKFRLSDRVVTIPHIASVARKTQDYIGLEFAPLTKAIQDNFQAVVDDFRDRESATGQ